MFLISTGSSVLLAIVLSVVGCAIFIIICLLALYYYNESNDNKTNKDVDMNKLIDELYEDEIVREYLHKQYKEYKEQMERVNKIINKDKEGK